MILLTALPRTGKSTAIKKIVNMLGKDNCGGFYTEEIRKSIAYVREYTGKEFDFEVKFLLELSTKLSVIYGIIFPFLTGEVISYSFEWIPWFELTFIKGKSFFEL